MFNKQYFQNIIHLEPRVRIVGFSEEVKVHITAPYEDFIIFRVDLYEGTYLGPIDVAYEHIVSIR